MENNPVNILLLQKNGSMSIFISINKKQQGLHKNMSSKKHAEQFAEKTIGLPSDSELSHPSPAERPPASDDDDNDKYRQFYKTAAFYLYELFVSAYIAKDGQMSDYQMRANSVREKGLIDFCAGQFVSFPSEDHMHDELSVIHSSWKPERHEDLSEFIEDLDKVAGARFISGVTINSYDQYFSIEVTRPDEFLRLIQGYINYYNISTLDDISATSPATRRMKNIEKAIAPLAKADLCKGLSSEWGRATDAVDISFIPVNHNAPTLDGVTKGLIFAQEINLDVAPLSMNALGNILRDCKGLPPKPNMGPALIH